VRAANTADNAGVVELASTRPEPRSRLFLPALLENPIHGGFAYFQLEGNFGKCLAVRFEAQHLVRVARCAWSASDSAMCPRTLQPSDSAFTKPDALLLRNDGKNRDHGLPKHAARI